MLRLGKMQLPGTTLAEMYHTKEPFLEGITVPVIDRKFNWIPTQKGEGDPAYMLSAPYNPFGVKTIEYKQHAVKSDFPKHNAYGGSAVLWNDGDYDDIRKAMDMDYTEDEIGLKKAFKPSEIVNYLREEAENSLNNAMKEFFVSQAKNDTESKRYFLEQYGLTPDETEGLLRQQKVESAALAMKSRMTGTTRLDPARVKLNMIAENYNRGDVPMVAMNARRGIGDFDLGITGFEGRHPHYQSRTTAAGRRAAAYAGATQDALSGLPDRTPGAALPPYPGRRRARAASPASSTGDLTGDAGMSSGMDTEAFATARLMARGAAKKGQVVREFAGRKQTTIAAAEARLKEVKKAPSGRKTAAAEAESAALPPGQATISSFFRGEGAGKK